MHADVEILLERLGADRDAVVLVHRDRRLRAGDLLDAVHRAARLLDAHLPGDQLPDDQLPDARLPDRPDHRVSGPGRIAVLVGGNEPETLIARWAATLIGLGVTQPYAGLSAAARGRIVDDVEAALVLVAPGHEDEAATVLAHAGPVPRLAVDTLADRRGDATPVACRARPGDVEQIRHTGGTTGHPKGIVHTFAHHLQRVTGSGPGAPWRRTDTPTRQLVATTIAHMAGYAVDATLRGGGTVVLLDRFEPAEVLATIERERITDLWLLPPLLYRLLDAGDPPGSTLAHTDTSSLRTLVYGGASATPRRITEALERFGPVLVQFYGQTEAGGISMLTPAEHAHPELLATVGRVLPGVEVAVCDGEGVRLPDGRVGELWTRTGAAMDRYWKQPGLTARTVTPDGWVRTGDVGHLDARGYLHVDDRLGDVVVVVGGHVHTPEVEGVLGEHPGVGQAAVFGVPAADGSESLHAVVVATGAGVDPDELVALVTRQMGAMYAPGRVDVVDALPLTDAGKVDKKALRDRALRPASG